MCEGSSSAQQKLAAQRAYLKEQATETVLWIKEECGRRASAAREGAERVMYNVMRGQALVVLAERGVEVQEV